MPATHQSRRTAQPKTVYRKNKIVLTLRGRKIFECRDFDGIKSFLKGWAEAAAAKARHNLLAAPAA